MMQMVDLPMLYESTVVEPWIDYNGHMTEYSYNYLFAEAITVFFERLDAGSDYLVRTGQTLYTVEHHVTFRREMKLGAALSISFRLHAFSPHSLHMYGEMEDGDGRIAAAYESIVVNVRQKDGVARVTPFSDADLHVLADVRRSSARLDAPRLPTGRVAIRP
jgi:acyl-CoA thioester hydrolase